MPNLESLGRKDFEKHAAWGFQLADDSGQFGTKPIPDCPTHSFEALKCSVAVRTIFKCRNGSEFVGYIIWYKDGEIRHLQPVIFAEGGAVYFYFGIRKPTVQQVKEASLKLGGNAFPIQFNSEALSWLPSLRGEIQGLYYKSNSHILCRCEE